ncbi:hypothetical protein [Streptomyces sp. NPDC055287]
MRPTGVFAGRGRLRTDLVKATAAAVREASTDGSGACGGGFLGRSDNPYLIQEHTMADMAFAVTTIAVFALVAVVAKGVAKL